jgi:hypothetical protein
MDVEKPKKGGSDAVRFNVYLPREAYAKLEELRELTGRRSLAETIRAAVNLYMSIQEEIEDGKEIFMKGKEDKHSVKLKLPSH